MMERLFETHEVRKQKSLDGIWTFYPDTDPADRRKVLVPSCVETYPGYENYRGKCVFEREVYLEGNTRFCFKGVSHTAEVFLDGERIGTHYNAYTPFEFVIKQAGRGRHTLRVTADNSCHAHSSLHVVNDYYNYGGITRPVVVETLKDCWVKRIHVTPAREQGIWTATVQVWMENLTEKRQENVLCIRLEDETVCQEDLEMEPGETIWEKKLRFPGVETYEPETPKLYRIQALLKRGETAEDDLIDRVGFREITVRQDRIYFNERILSIRGFNRHEEHAQFGCALPIEAMDQDLRLIEAMGANAVRTCHYPNDERFLDLCDEKGILVWEEGHARGLSEAQMRHPDFRRQSLDCLEEMVENHYNHPSIFVWGILNECASDTEYGRIVYREQYEKLRSMDASRPVTSATCRHFTDICLDLPDIVSVNLYPGWYHDEPVKECLEKEYEWIQTAGGAGKPLLVSEIGAGGISGYHAAHRPKWSEERQSDILKEQLEGVLGFQPASGLFIWQFCDGRVPDENFYARPGCKNNKGVVDGNRQRKLAFETVRQLFRAERAKEEKSR